MTTPPPPPPHIPERNRNISDFSNSRFLWIDDLEHPGRGVTDDSNKCPAEIYKNMPKMFI